MKALPLSEVKMKFSSLVEAVSSTDEEIMITKNGTAVAMLISADEYESLKETVAIRSDPELMKEIKTGIKELRTKKTHIYTFDDLFR